MAKLTAEQMEKNIKKNTDPNGYKKAIYEAGTKRLRQSTSDGYMVKKRPTKLPGWINREIKKDKKMSPDEYLRKMAQ